MGKQKEEARKLREITIALDEYDDIFSDFDSRKYSERALSDDFITEVLKQSRESEEDVGMLNFTMPAKLRDNETETVIKKRLQAHFSENFKKHSSERRNTFIKGFAIFLAGTMLMLLASYVASFKTNSFRSNFLFVILEPAGWFAVWTGFETLFNNLKSSGQFKFYSRLVDCDIRFKDE